MINLLKPRPHICRLFVLMARDARIAAIFRHGPNNYTRLIRWDLKTDRFEAGQWFKGSIFDREADIAPNGDFLIYYATKHLDDPAAWTAISQPPYFTALALWPQTRRESGGGLFETEYKVLLNHRASETSLMKGFRLRKGMTVERRNWEAHRGRDLYHVRLLRDGWMQLDDDVNLDPANARWPVYEKTSRFSIRLRMQMYRRRSKDQVDYEVLLPNDTVWMKWPSIDWADFDHTGDLLIARGGSLWRLPQAQIGLPDIQAHCIADFSKMQFEAVKAPPGASHWPNKPRSS